MEGGEGDKDLRSYRGMGEVRGSGGWGGHFVSSSEARAMVV